MDFTSIRQDFHLRVVVPNMPIRLMAFPFFFAV
jgi:hypothetical protein